MTAIVAGAVEAPSARWPGYPLGLEPIVLRALSPRAGDRFATAQELSRALAELAANQGVAPSAAGLAALLAGTFGDEASGAIAADKSQGHEVSSTADTSPARPSSVARDRTATDHQAAAAIRPLMEPGSEALRAVTARRIALFAGVGLACVGAVAVAAPWLRKAPVAPVPVVRPAAPVVPVVPEVGPTTTTTATTTATTPAPETPVVKKRVKRPVVVAPPLPPAEKVKVWDPDSPVPPPP
jgi:hypothetical protein